MADTPTESEERRQRRDELTALLLALMDRTRATMRALAASVSAGEITATDFGNQALDALEQAHSEAAMLGRQLAGIEGELSDADLAFGQAVTSEQSAFMAGFVASIGMGHYLQEDGTQNAAAIALRAELYAERLYGTAYEAWFEAYPEYEDVEQADGTAVATLVLYVWGDTGDSRECDVCPDLAAGSPYTREALPTTPGAGDTPCGNLCRCDLTTTTGGSGFVMPPSGPGHENAQAEEEGDAGE